MVGAADNSTSTREWRDDDGGDWEIDLWDSDGEAALPKLRKLAYPGTQILLVGFDMTNGNSLESLPTWVEEVIALEPNVSAIIIVGTKSDLYEELNEAGTAPDGSKLKTIEQMHQWAVAVGAHAFICTSAKTGYGVMEQAESGPAVGCEGDMMSGADEKEQFLDRLIMKFALTDREGLLNAKLQSGLHRSATQIPDCLPGGVVVSHIWAENEVVADWFRGQPVAGASDAEIADWFRQQPAGGEAGGGSEWFRGQPAAGASDAEIADWFRQQPAATAGKQSIDDPQGITVLDERAVILEGVAPWDMVLHEWFRVRDVNNSGDFDEEEYVHLNRRMHPRYFDDNVPFDEQKHREKFKSMDTNQVSCIWPALVVLLARANQYSYAACCGCTGKCLCSAGW